MWERPPLPSPSARLSSFLQSVLCTICSHYRAHHQSSLWTWKPNPNLIRLLVTVARQVSSFVDSPLVYDRDHGHISDYLYSSIRSFPKTSTHQKWIVSLRNWKYVWEWLRKLVVPRNCWGNKWRKNEGTREHKVAPRNYKHGEAWSFLFSFTECGAKKGKAIFACT